MSLKHRLESFVFHLLLALAVGLLGWLSTRYDSQWDWSFGGRNSLSEASQTLLKRLDQPLRITSFAPETPLLRQRVREMIQRYQRYKSDTELRFVNPETHPEQARRLGITLSGELLMEYGGRSETLKRITEEDLTNALQRLARQREHWVVPLSGHGERSFTAAANFDLGDFGAELARKGFQVRPLDLVTTPTVPDNTGLLVIASPRVTYLPGEAVQIRDYLKRGGNLLWLTEPGEIQGLNTLADALGLGFLPGTIVDANAGALKIDDPAVALVPRYSAHPATRDFELLTLYPHAQALETRETPPWQAASLLRTLPRTWNETGPIQGEVSRNAELGERAGPLDIGIAFVRDIEREDGPHQQRVLVIGDGDFLSNAFLGNGGNLNLGLNLVRWLIGEERLLNIPPRTAPDLSLNLSTTATAVIGLGFLLLLPSALLGSGLFIWWRRRRR